MVKPIYLVSVDDRSYYVEVVADSRAKKIGRNLDCCFVTPAEDLSISRVQGCVIHTPHDGIHFYHEGERSKTYLDGRRLKRDVDERVACGHILTIGDNGYQIEIVSYNNMKSVLDFRKRAERSRLDDTQYLSNSGLQNQ